jgi:hypothetical protein
MIQTVLLAIIGLLGVYIVYLHIRIIRKNLLIETIIKKITGIEKELDAREIKKFIGELHNFNLKRAVSEDRLFNEDILSFIFGDGRNLKTYIHYTMDQAVAETILKEGFRFADTFHKTALQVSEDKLDLMIKHNNKKYYGDYIIVICIAEEIIKLYTEEMERAGLRNYSYENILTEKQPEKGENSESIFLLPKQFIKGYLNYKTGEIHANGSFDPGYTSPGFSENIRKLTVKGF